MGQEFPHPGHINRFEELAGPDGDIARRNLIVSYMHYNPVSGKGRGPQAVEHLYNIAQQRINHSSISSPEIGRVLAYLSHMTVDSLSPAHQFGFPKNYSFRFLFWNINTDWAGGDEIFRYRKKLSYHTLFELRILCYFFRRLGNMSIQKDLADQLKLPSFTVREYMVKRVGKVHNLDLYRQYIAHGWSKEIRVKLDKVIFPEIISTVASLWYSLIPRK